jgi:hypothetical protein
MRMYYDFNNYLIIYVHCLCALFECFYAPIYDFNNN